MMVAASVLGPVYHKPTRPPAVRQNAAAPTSAIAESAPAFDPDPAAVSPKDGQTPLPIIKASKDMQGPFRVAATDLATSSVPLRDGVPQRKRPARTAAAAATILLVVSGVASLYPETRGRVTGAIGWPSSNGTTVDISPAALPTVVAVPVTPPTVVPDHSKPGQNPVGEPEGADADRAGTVSPVRPITDATQTARLVPHNDAAAVNAVTSVESPSSANDSTVASTRENEPRAANTVAISPTGGVSGSGAPSADVTPPVGTRALGSVAAASEVVAPIVNHDALADFAANPATAETRSAMTTLPSPASHVERQPDSRDVPSQLQHDSPATPVQPRVVAPVSSEDVTLLLNRGEAMLQQRNVLSARLFFERAAEKGSARGATGAGRTYDPNFLATIAATGMQGNVVRAIEWYRKASTVLGDREAEVLLNRLIAQSGR